MCLGIPGELIEIEAEPEGPATAGLEPVGRLGLVSFGGARKRVCLDFVPEAEVGDYVIVHAGFALSRIDPAEADSLFEMLGHLDAPAVDP